jgi:ubiquinone/menaquinone biosynthesis C-methylase UbiE
MREQVFKRRLIAQASIRPDQRVLDLGCGTGTLTILVKQLYPGAEVVGLDPDSQILHIAMKKAVHQGVLVTWEEGTATALAYANETFDRVLTSLVLHHLTSVEKRRAFGEILRVLRPGGELHILDFGKPRTPVMRLLAATILRFERTEDNLKGLLPVIMQESGFTQVQEMGAMSTIIGFLSFYKGVKPS